MLTKTIGQLSAATSIADADLIEIEQSGVSKYGTVAMLETNLITNNIATTAQSLLASSNSALMTPVQVREAFSANDESPVYACRAWVSYDGTASTASINGTYTRSAGTTLTICVATAHTYINGNIASIDFTSGGASDNSYIVTVIDSNTFSINTISTSSVLTSNFTIKRCPIFNSKNVSSISFESTGSGNYYVNTSTPMPSSAYSVVANANANAGTGPLIISQSTTAVITTVGVSSFPLIAIAYTGVATFSPKVSCAVFA